ncbi:MAG: bifunctional UDP-N-acetylglucosamine diphosphorylase/glucosamine-1-phosphate N-acetyltransferase GlmU [Propionibacteriales bacterium]|nr:bifunctional UDP-N-acetylglucosamine diphosphorylase/glucosamine-1-phosphate N-acetyltransferase GlmU [Propionibacteriales bacterium]
MAAVIVLAAGEGTRMKSKIPKVLHRLGGRSLLEHAMRAGRAVDPPPEHLVVVIGHGRELVEPHVRELDDAAQMVVQEEQLGTGHAVQCALAALPSVQGTVMVTYADTPLLTAETLTDLHSRHASSGAAVSLLTADLADPSGYGRVVRDSASSVVAIVEHDDASEEQQAITEVNSGIYAFDGETLHAALGRLDADNAQGELYLTDVVGIVRAEGREVIGVPVADVRQTEGVNDRVQLSVLGAELNRRILTRHMRAGVTVVDPATTWVDDSVELGTDVTLHPGVQLHGQTRVAAGATIGPDTTLTDVTVGEGAAVVRTHGVGAVIGGQATVGPFAYLRPGTTLGGEAKIGAFVEAKNAHLAEGAKVPHLSYVGDADIGEHTNIGAGTIFANYDGVAKRHTTIGREVKGGSNSTFVAPVEVGDGAATGAGTVVRQDVPPGALAVSSGPQRHLDDWTIRKRPGTPAAEAARRAQETATGPDVHNSDETPNGRQ